jgi:hypothetical protein
LFHQVLKSSAICAKGVSTVVETSQPGASDVS